jgi:glyoxylase-like metal-dependent hydrolase (beta-lactamase superfamily II)
VTTSTRLVARDVHRLGDRDVNWWLVIEGGAATLVDAGLPAQYGQLTSLLGSLGLGVGDIGAVVVTHGHVDHFACVPALRRDVPGLDVYLPKDDRSLAAQRPGLDARVVANSWRPAAIRTAASYARQGMLRARPLVDARDLDDGDVLDLPGRPRFVHAPGHTPGSGMFVFEDRDVVCSGDVLVTYDPFTGRRGPRTLPAFDNVDHEQALASLERVAETGMGIVLPGHGEPWVRRP